MRDARQKAKKYGPAVSSFSKSKADSGARTVQNAAGILVLAAVLAHAGSAFAQGFAVFGAPKYPADFTHFDYVNPDAPKGCTWRQSPAVRQNGFDSLNPFI